jgi:hypothetical protein
LSAALKWRKCSGISQHATRREAHVSKLSFILSRASPVAKALTSMLTMAYLAMLRFTDLAHPGRKRWCTAIVLVAVCALTVSVATRYGSPVASDAKVNVLQSQSSWEPGIQRLLNNAATWIPPVIISVLLQDPGYSPHVAPSRPIFRSVLLESDLYNRPPPTRNSVCS